MKIRQPFKTIIVDDEPLARFRLKKLVSEYPDNFQLIDEAGNGDEAIEKINSKKPDLIFLDIQMPETDGFEVLRQIKDIPKVIFCTAFDEFALQAFETNCVDYLVKPLTKERFLKTVHKLEKLNGETEINLEMLFKQFQLNNKKSETTTIPVKVGDRVIFIRLEEVSYFKADEKYISIITKHSKEYLMDSSLKKLEEKLPPYFVRVHKSFIINKKLLKEIRKYFNNRFVLILEDYNRSKITSGRNYYSIIKNLVKI